MIYQLIPVYTFILALAFWSGYMWGKVKRNERDIAKFDESVSDSLRRLHEKIDRLPCKNSGWNQKDCA